jgi:hypothetical protein
MKTPRELLLDQHRQAEARLDAIRGEVVHAMGARPDAEMPRAKAGIGLLASCWQELFVHCRRYWIGLGAAWAVVLVFVAAGAFSHKDGRVMASASGATLEAMQAQQQLRNELLGVAVIEPARVTRPDPGPRSDVIRAERYV